MNERMFNSKILMYIFLDMNRHTNCQIIYSFKPLIFFFFFVTVCLLFMEDDILFLAPALHKGVLRYVYLTWSYLILSQT